MAAGEVQEAVPATTAAVAADGQQHDEQSVMWTL